MLSDLEVTDLWWHWRLDLFRREAIPSIARRTCRKGHDWQTYLEVVRIKGKPFERCGQCRREASQRHHARKAKAA